jgi:hypothetical protein
VVEEPSGELGANGPDVEACVRDAIEALQRRPQHDPKTGRFVAGNVAPGTTLARSVGFWSAVADVKAQLVARVQSDIGNASDPAETMIGLIDGYAEARLFRQAMGVRLVELGGPVTAKGKARALYSAYLGALDREMRLAQLLGLERRARKVASLEDVLAAHEESNGGAHGA